MSITIKDVAKAAGVSPSTVSRTLKDHYSISEKTKNKIRKVMDELGYQNNLTPNDKKSIGVVFPKSHIDAYENPFYMEAVRGISKICNQQNYIMTIITGSDDKELYKSIRNSNADGYIFLYSNLDDKLINYMYDENFKFVLIGKATKMINSTLYVDNDNVQAGYEACEYLIKLGHEKIGYIGTGDKRIYSMDRKLGYMQALEANNIEYNESYIKMISSKAYYDSTPLIDLLKRNDHPTAFLVCDDTRAIILEIAIRETGLSIPNDVSIISFNNSIFSRLMNPPLTSIDVNSKQLGIEAASQLIKHIENPDLFATKIIVPYYLVERKSCKKLKND